MKKSQTPNSKFQINPETQIPNSKIKEFLPGVQRNVFLKNYTTFKIGGKAKYFFAAKNKEGLIKAVSMAKKFELPFFILGGGSNLLVADEGFKGLVIKLQITNYKLQIKSKCLNPKIYVEAGVSLASLVSEATKNNLTGLEWAAGIPGTIGGAIYGNAGAFEKSIGDVVKSVEVLDIQRSKFPISNFQFPNKFQIPNPKFKTKILKNRDCKFGYRDSIFKHNRNLIILSAEFQLKKGKKREIERKIKEFLDYRMETQPLSFPSAGSVFKNPSGFSVAWLIEKCGLKGKMIGKAKISEKHANFIINLGGAKAKDVKKLINLIKKKVKKNFGITLEEEIQYLGFEKHFF
jgi:UDP-N-acetylmuramate dehydrogenase